MIDVAVVGCGHMGRLHARAVAAHPGCRLVATVDRHPERAHAVAGRYGAEGCTTVPDVEVVVVCTPTTTHRQVAEPLLGRWLLVEKALAATAADAAALVHPRVAVAHSERFHPAVRRLGPVTPVHFLSRRLAPPGSRGRDVSAILDLMVHDLDLLLAWSGEDLEAVEATGDAEQCTARLRLGGGTRASLEVSRRALAPERTVRVQEPAGFLGLDLRTGGLWRRGAPLLPTAPGDALTAQWRAFVAAIRGEVAVPIPASHGLRVVEAALAVEASLQPG